MPNSSKIIIQFIKVDYDFRGKKTKRDDNIKLLGSPLKDFISNEISPKYKKNNYIINFNEILIETLLKDENNKDIFNFIFNFLTFEDFLDLFSYKKKLSDFIGYNLLNPAQKKEIKDNLYKYRIDTIINEIYNNHEDYIYSYCFFLLLYNLKRYFTKKEIRRPKTKKDKHSKKNRIIQMKIEKQIIQ